MNKLILPLLLIINFTVLSYSQIETEGGGIVYGGELGIIVSAPEGWVFDAQSGVSQGLHAVMYPEGSSWDKSGEVMYVSIDELEADDTLETLIAADIARCEKISPDLKVDKLDPITLISRTIAEVRVFSGDKYDNYECIAYAQKDSSVAIYVLSCRSKEGYEKSIGAFKEMVSKSGLTEIR